MADKPNENQRPELESWSSMKKSGCKDKVRERWRCWLRLGVRMINELLSDSSEQRRAAGT